MQLSSVHFIQRVTNIIRSSRHSVHLWMNTRITRMYPLRHMDSMGKWTKSKSLVGSIVVNALRPVKVSFPHKWDDEFGTFVDSLAACHPLNLDHNSGNPLGIAVCQTSSLNGRRTTASDAFLSSTPANLTIMTDAPVSRVLIKDEKAIGVHVLGKDSQHHPFHS